MPVVPITQARIKPKGLPDVPPPSEPFALMAAAQMHAEGRLIEPHTVEEGPESNKWDESLSQYGAIRIPKERDNPQEWMNQFDKDNQSNGIDREDRPDGSVILRKQSPSS